jgi:hypothetical protein
VLSSGGARQTLRRRNKNWKERKEVSTIMTGEAEIETGIATAIATAIEVQVVLSEGLRVLFCQRTPRLIIKTLPCWKKL